MLKNALAQLIYGGGPASLARWVMQDRTLVVAYHNILPDHVDPSGQSVLHLSRKSLREQLSILSATHQIVPLSKMLEEGPKDTSGPRAVVTFDDAYRGAMTIGVEELVRQGIPATFFVAPKFVGGRSFWWDVVKPSKTEVSWREFRERAIAELAGDDNLIRRSARVCGFGVHEVSQYERCASEDELEAAAARPGITLAAHSWSHRNLPRLSDHQLQEELKRPHNWLSHRFSEAVLPWIAYPYGFSSERVQAMTQSLGYKGAFRLANTCWLPRKPDHPFALPRLSIPRGMTRSQFGLRVSGL